MAEPDYGQVVSTPRACTRSHDSVTWGDIRLSPWESLRKSITDRPLRSHLSSLMRMYRSSASSEWGGVQRGIGILTVGGQQFVPLDEPGQRAVEEFRAMLFLCSLSSGVHRVGPNAGHSLFTTENFSVVYQNFQVGKNSLSESSGTILTLTSIGYRIGSTKFVKPGYVPSPSRFEYDETLLHSLARLRRGDARLLRRITRAASAFCESYHNSPALDVNARILLQASAFEILLDLPEKAPRKEFKNRVEELCARAGDRRISYVYRIWGQKHRESRTVFGLWAERFYQLRNGIVHGDSLSRRDYVFRGAQHHVLIAAHVFVACTKALINEAFRARSRRPPHSDRIFWGRALGDKKDAEAGFRTEVDWAARLGYR